MPYRHIYILKKHISHFTTVQYCRTNDSSFTLPPLSIVTEAVLGRERKSLKQGFYKRYTFICTRIKIQKRIDKPTVQALGGNCPHFIFLFRIPYVCTVQYSTGFLPPFFPSIVTEAVLGRGRGGEERLTTKKTS